MTLSVIIVNYNVRAFLEHALYSVCKSLNSVDGEIIVVDNASDDGSVEMVQQKFPGVKLIVNDHNVGFAAANNKGMKESSGEFLLLLNPDTIVQENTFTVMIDFFRAHSGVGLAGCKILNPDGSLQLACRRSFPTPWVAFTKIIGLSSVFPRSTLFGRYNLTYLDEDETCRVDAVSGSFMFLRRTVLEVTGGLDEQFFMYGEDLDWCFRVKQAGWEIYYVHETQIIHYKGESARRSDIDEVKLFYQAMRTFVRKHFRRGIFSDIILPAGIALREGIAFLGKMAKPLWAALVDIFFVNVSLLLGELLWFGKMFHFPSYAYPVIMTVPGMVMVGVMYSSGVYTSRKFSVGRAASSVLVGYIILSALTFFFKQYGFSRMVVFISGLLSMVVLPGWRVVARVLAGSSEHRRRSLFGRRTVIVGAESSGLEVLRKLRVRVDDGYDVVGFIDLNRKRVGEKIAGVEILGSIDNIGKVIQEKRVSDVIFSTDVLSYADILAVIGKGLRRTVNFRLVPSGIDVIIGKTHIDVLDDIPLVEIEYNIDKQVNRFLKRLFDITLSLFFIAVIYPAVVLKKKSGKPIRLFGRKVLLMPEVFFGRMSFVGPPEYVLHETRNGSVHAPTYLGKPGVTGLVQVNYHEELTPAEIEQYNLYYAKNQSLALDMEILVKAFTLFIKG